MTPRHRCPYCGRHYTPPANGPEACRVCRGVMATEREQSQSSDPSFVDRVATLLIARFGSWTDVATELACPPMEARQACRALRRWGFVIDGHPGRRGHRLSGWTRQRQET
jgi:hypothetical protein